MHSKQSIFSRFSGRSFIRASGGIAIALAVSGVALADNSPWYIVPQLGVISPDDDRGDFDNGTLGALSLGRELGEQFAVELRAATFAINGSVEDRNTDQISLGVDAHWYPFGRLLDDAILRPYLLAGLAYVETDIGDNFSSENAATSIGLGASLRVFDTGLAVRGESRYVTDFVDANDVSSFSDWQSTLALQIPIGRQGETAASPVVQPAPTTRKPVVARKTQAKPISRPKPTPNAEPAFKPKPADKSYSPFAESAPASASTVPASPLRARETTVPPPEPEVVEAAPRKPAKAKPAQNAPAKPASNTTKPETAAKPATSSGQPETTARRSAPAGNALLSSGTTDSDGDGIRDSVDLCAATPSGGYVDADGCPLQFGGKQVASAALKPATKQATAAAKPGSAKPVASLPKIAAAAKPPAETSRSATTITLKGVAFASGSATLTADSGKAIARVAALMMKKPGLQVEIAGHTDNQGNKAANLELSERRAQAVKNALIAQGISFRRIATKGYGDTKPVASNETAAGKKENRRIEIKLLREQ